MRPDLALQRVNGHVMTIGQFRLDDLGLVVNVSEPVDFEAWETTGKLFERADRALKWWVGDWLIYGEGAYGERYSQAIDSTGWDYQTIANARWVAGQIAYSRRRECLSWSHHAEVASLGEAEQDELLDSAIEYNWSVKELRSAVRAKQGKTPATRETDATKPTATTGAVDPRLREGGVLDLALFQDESIDVIIARPPARDDYWTMHQTNREFLKIVRRVLVPGGCLFLLAEWRNAPSLVHAAHEQDLLVATWVLVTLREGTRLPCLWVRNDRPVSQEEVPAVYWNPATYVGLYQIVLADILKPDDMVAEVWLDDRPTAQDLVAELGGRYWNPPRTTRSINH